MWLRLKDLDRDAPRRKLRWIGFIAFLSVGLFGVAARTADAPPISPPTTDAAAAPAADMNMHSAGWLERIIVDLEREASSDISMLPDTPSATNRSTLNPCRLSRVYSGSSTASSSEINSTASRDRGSSAETTAAKPP